MFEGSSRLSKHQPVDVVAARLSRDECSTAPVQDLLRHAASGLLEVWRVLQMWSSTLATVQDSVPNFFLLRTSTAKIQLPLELESCVVIRRFPATHAYSSTSRSGS